MKRILLFIFIGVICNISISQNRNTTDYETKWKKTDSLMANSLPKSALDEIVAIYTDAMTDKDYAQALKALCYRFYNQLSLGEDKQPVFDSLKRDVNLLPQPAKSAGYALIANTYREYYKDNWRIRNRERSAVVDDDMATWDITRFFEEALKYYRLSIQNETLLKQTPLDDYQAIVEYRVDTTLQRVVLPTLYDFLVFNAIEAFSSEMSVVLPQQTFVLDKPEYLADVNTFVNHRIATSDSLSAEYNALILYQQLLKFRLQDSNNRAALASLNVERLRYVYNKGKYDDVVYENVLKTLMETYSESVEWTYPAFALALLYEKQGSETQQNSLFRYRLKDANSLCAEIVARYRTKSAARAIVAAATGLKIRINHPSTTVIVKQLQCPNSPVLAQVNYRNTDNIHVKIHKTNDEAVYYSGNLSDFKNKKPFAEQKIAVPRWDDYQEHSTEIMLDGLPQGVYVILADDTIKGNVFSCVLQVSPLNVALHGALENLDCETQIYVANAKTGKPVPNATIEYFLENKEINTYKTDHAGIAYIPKPGTQDRIMKVIISNGVERLVLNNWYAHNYSNSSNHHRKMAFFTDRSTYRPGQTVYYKALYFEHLNGKSALLKNEDIKVDFYDVNGKIIASQQHRTNDYGSAQGSFTIPQGLLNGQMRLGSQHDFQYISVEEYKRPTFEVKFDALAKNYRLNDSIQLVGRANALAGYVVDNAKVQYHIVRNVSYRVHHWWLPPLNMPTREIAVGTVNTDDKGRFVINLKAEADDVVNDNLVYRYHGIANVTDINGETRGANISIRIGNKPLVVTTSIPQQIIDRDRLDFQLGTTNLNNDFTPADLKIEIFALKSPDGILHERLWSRPDTLTMSRAEFKKHFPLDPYGDEDIIEKYPKTKLITSYTMKTKSKNDTVSLQSLANVSAGWYCVEIKATNADGIEVEHRSYVQLFGNRITNSSKLVPSPIKNMSNWLTVVKNSCKPDEYAEFWVGGSEKQSYIHYDVVHRNRIVERKTIVVIAPTRIVIPVKEEYRGGFSVQFLMMQNGRTYAKIARLNVPYTDKLLDIKFTTFRDKLLPGEKEKWTLAVKNKKGDKETAEMVATLYDASLDAFHPHSWYHSNVMHLYPHDRYSNEWRLSGQHIVSAGVSNNRYFNGGKIFAYPLLMPHNVFSNKNVALKSLRSMAIGNSFDFSEGEVVLVGFGTQKRESVLKEPVLESIPPAVVLNVPDSRKRPLTDIATRQNFNETAFFYPQLRTDENGEISIEFTIPETLTRWKMLGFAHTTDFKTGQVTNELITQKQVAISLNAPRFFRENDTIELTAKVNNVSDGDLSGQALLRLYDAVTMQPVDDKIIRSQPTLSLDVKAGLSAGLKWTLIIPENMQAISYKVTAQAGSHTDGEEKIVPVLKNSVLVTETMPFSIRAGKQKSLTFNNFKNNKSSTLRNHRLTLEFTSNPAWYAIQAMPYLMEYPYECSEQTFSRFYANSLSATVVNSSPRVKQIFEMWRNLPEFKDALLSNLEKNQELKQVLLEETPWVVQAQNETEQKKRIGLLFDLNRMSAEQQLAFDKVKKAQRNDGGFPWFSGCPSSYFITSHIISGFEHLDKLNALGDFKDDVRAVINKGLQFMDNNMRENYERLLKLKADMNGVNIGYSEIKYLYTCSFSLHKPQDTLAFDYYFAQAQRYWTEFNLYAQAMIALSMHRFGDDKTATAIIRSLKERSQQSDEMGMYWKDNVTGYFWYQATIETQAMLIEAFNEAANDKRSVEEMKIWLLRNKQTNDWRTTKATAEACYALLMTGANLLDENRTLEVTIGGKSLNEAAKEEVRPEAGTGYVKTAWAGADINRDMAAVTVANPNRNGIAWGGLYWQYFEQLDKVVGAETSLKMDKQLFRKTVTERGAELLPLNENNVLNVGDIVTVRMILRADRDYEFVHLKDMRAANLEPTRSLSGHRYQDGLWYYESIKDASMNFFITYLNKGVYVFDYDLRVTHAGQFSNGITTFQCMYAPEFSSHSSGVRIKAK